MPHFFTNTIWFIFLGITTALELTYTLAKVHNRKQLFAFYLTASGVVFVFEAMIFMILKAYNYYPMIIPNNTLHDGLVGNLFSQFSVSATALLLVTLHLSKFYYIIFAIIYGGIEELFLYLGIYQHNWYQTWMTVILFPIYCKLVEVMYAIIHRKLTPVLSYLYMFLGLWSLHFGITVFPFMIYGYQIYHSHIFPDPTTNETILLILNYILQFTIMRRIYFSNNKRLWMPISVSVILFIDFIQYQLQLLYVKEGLFLIYSIINVLSMYLYIYLYDKLANNN